MQYRLQQASTNDRERRMLLTQLESRMETQKALVRLYSTPKEIAFNFCTQKAGFATSGMVGTAIQATSREVCTHVNSHAYIISRNFCHRICLAWMLLLLLNMM